MDFIAALTAHIPPKDKQYIRRYGLYSSRTRGVWQRMEFCVRLAPQGWKEKHLDNPAEPEQLSVEIPECSVEKKVEKSTWARLRTLHKDMCLAGRPRVIKKVYSTDPLLCPRCGSQMKILAIVMDPGQTDKTLTTFGCLTPDQDWQPDGPLRRTGTPPSQF